MPDKEKQLIEDIKNKKPYLFWRGDIFDVDELLVNVVSMQDLEVLRYMYDKLGYEDIKRRFMKIRDYFVHPEHKKRYDKAFNSVIYFDKDVKIKPNMRFFFIPGVSKYKKVKK